MFDYLQHEEVPIPSPRKDEVLIKVEAASLNPVDWKAYNLRIMLRPLLSRNSHSPVPSKLTNHPPRTMINLCVCVV